MKHTRYKQIKIQNEMRLRMIDEAEMEHTAAASRSYADGGGGGIWKQQVQHLSCGGGGPQHSQVIHTGPR